MDTRHQKCPRAQIILQKRHAISVASDGVPNIYDGGPFHRACAELVELGFIMPYVERWGDDDAKTRKKKAASKTKYTCPGCGLNAWAKPEAVLRCGDCEAELVAEDE